jgi:hypothetical protein
MPSRSQRHLREVFGVDSAGDETDNTSSPASPGGVTTAAGTQTEAAVFSVPSPLLAGKRVTVSITADEETPDTFFVDAGLTNKSGLAVASELAALIGADPQYSASSSRLSVSVLAVDPVEAVTINSVVISDTPE